MAAGFLQRLAGEQVEVISAGSEPADRANPVAVQAMSEKGIDISREVPTSLADTAVRVADVVITMGCEDPCPFYPGKRYGDWELDDPAGRNLEQVRPISDEIEKRVRQLLPSSCQPPRNAVADHRWQSGRGQRRN